MKSLFNSRTTGLGLAVMVLSLAQYLEAVPGLPPWAVAAIGALIVILRAVTRDAVELRLPRLPKPPPPAALIVCGLLLGGCGAAMCTQSSMTRNPHPSMPPPAACYVWECDGKTEEMCIEAPNPCMDGCFEAAP